MAGIAVVMREIHRLRRFTTDLKEQLDRIPRQLKAQQAKVAREETALKAHQDAIRQLKVRVNDKEVTLKATLASLAKHQKQLQEATAPKEYEALQKESAAEKAAIAKLEDEILASITEGEEKATATPALEAAVKKAKQEFNDFEKGIGARQSELASQFAEADAQLKEVEKQIPEKHLSGYNRMVASMGADALAPIVGSSCGACYTEITVQSLNDLGQEMFMTCKSCYRILFVPE